MPSIKPKCPQCGELTVIKSSEDLRPIGIQCIIYKLQCGHSITEETIEAPSVIEPELDPSFNGYGGFRAFDYQIEGVEFLEKANCIGLCADEMGLGKTPQGLLIYKRNKVKLTPTICVCKTSLHINWAREYCRWVLEVDPTDKEQMAKVPGTDLPFIHPSGDMGLPPGFNFYLVSMDMLGKAPVLNSIKNLIKPKFVLVDECHNFKDITSKRTKALMELIAYVPHKVFLSGTPIMNKTMEYFPVLNMLKPSYFPTQRIFAKEFLDWDYESKKWLGFSAYGKRKFFNFASQFMIRREQKDVQKDLPELFIQHHYANEFDKGLAKKYNKLADELEEAIDETGKKAANSSEILGIMSNLRHLVGQMKITAVLEHVTDFLEQTDEKICIGVHHIDVRLMLMAALAQFNPISISGEDGGKEKDQKLQQFARPENRVMICNILAGGEGLNIAFCNNFIVAERQWNPAKEKQFFKRFQRYGQKLTVFGHYITLPDTIDDFFEQLLQFKGSVVKDSTDSDYSQDRNFLVDLARKVVSTRLRVVKI